MASLIYGSLVSLDGCVADESGKFDWAVPDEEVHAFINELERSIGTHLYGRKLYETMAAWETPEVIPDPTPAIQEYAQIWATTDKIVYSSSLADVSTARTTLVRAFNPADVRRLKEQSNRDLSIGGPTLAAHALRAGLVDEVQVYVAPIIVGGGTPFLPDGIRLSLELQDERRFGNGMVFLRFRTAASESDQTGRR